MPLDIDFTSFNWESLVKKIQKYLEIIPLQVVIDRPWALILPCVIGLCLRGIVRKLRRRSISYLRGPSPVSWLVGNLPELLAGQEAGVNAFKWTKEFGNAVKITGFMGVKVLHLTDPRAVHHILNTAGYAYPKPQQSLATTRMMMGEGVIYSHGERHARQRKLMNPAFSPAVFPGYLEQFQLNIGKMTDIWKRMISQSADGKACIIDVPTWISRTTLSIIGQAGFNYDFGVLDDVKSPLAEAYKDLFAQTTYRRSHGTLVFESLWGALPFWMVKLIQRLPIGRLKRNQQYLRVARKVAGDMIKIQTELYHAGNERGRDILSTLIQANLSGDPSVKLSDYEIQSQLTTLMLAGHDTTASSIMWGLYELSADQVSQHRIREIAHVRSRMFERGDNMLTTTDLESMKFLDSFIKEVLRFHAVIPLLLRQSGHDDVLPLSQPVQTKDGRYIDSIPISKGQGIVISIVAYNRLKSVWGDDAETFRPDRFLGNSLKQEHKIGVGVTSNLLTFSSGIRNCIGWRFTLLEMQVIFLELLENFKFSPDPASQGEIFRAATSIITPMRKSNPGKTSLPLTISLI